MKRERIRELAPRARLFLKDRQNIKTKRLARHLDITTHDAGALMCCFLEWRRSTSNTPIWERIDINLISLSALQVYLTDYQFGFLRDRKEKTGQSMTAQIRLLIDNAIEPPFVPQYHQESRCAGIPPSTTKSRSFMKSPQASQINALTQELKAVFALKSKAPAYIG